MTKQQEALGTKQDTIPRDDYSLLFVNYVARGTSAALAIVDNGSTTLSEEQQNRVLHTLSLALQREEVWPQARTLLLRSSSHMEKAGLRDDWMLLLRRGVQLGDKLEDQGTLAELHLQLSVLYQLRSLLQKAEDHCESSVAKFTLTRNNYGLVRALNQWAYVARLRRSFHKAHELAIKALDVLSEGDVRRASSHVVLGWIATDTQDFGGAQKHFSLALEMWQAIGDQRQVGRRLRELGNLFHRQKCYEIATSYYKQARNIFEADQDQYEATVTMMNQALLYSSLEKYNEAIQLLDVAAKVFREVQDQRHLAMVFNNQGIIYRYLKNWDAAISSLQTSITLWRQVGNLDSMINVLDELALTMIDAGKIHEAIGLLQQAQDSLASFETDPAYPYRQKQISAHLTMALSQLQNEEL